MRAQLHLQHQHAVGRRFVFTGVFWGAAAHTGGVKKEMCFPSMGTDTSKAEGSPSSLPSQTYLVPLWGTAGAGTSAWPLVWQRGHSPGPALPPGSTSPPAVARQHHTSCCTVGVRKQEREHERHFLFFCSSQVLCATEVSGSLLWRLFLRRLGSNTTLISNLLSLFFTGGKHR